MRIHFGGVRKSFDLETGSKEEAATKARDIYLSLVAKGWAATLAELKPKASLPIEITAGDATVGEFLAEVERTSNFLASMKKVRETARSLRVFPTPAVAFILRSRRPEVNVAAI